MSRRSARPGASRAKPAAKPVVSPPVSSRDAAAERYQKRRGRALAPDALQGWSYAARAEIERWLVASLIPAYRAARAGNSIPTWDALEPWVRELLGVHLLARHELARRESVEAVRFGNELFANDLMMQQLLMDPPLPALRPMFTAYAKRFGRRRSRAAEPASSRPTETELDLLQGFVDLIRADDHVIADEVDTKTLDDLLALVAAWVPSVKVAEPDREAHGPKKAVVRAFYDGVKSWFTSQGYGMPTSTDLKDLSIWCGLDTGTRVLENWEARMTAYRKELASDPKAGR